MLIPESRILCILYNLIVITDASGYIFMLKMFAEEQFGNVGAIYSFFWVFDVTEMFSLFLLLLFCFGRTGQHCRHLRFIFKPSLYLGGSVFFCFFLPKQDRLSWDFSVHFFMLDNCKKTLKKNTFLIVYIFWFISLSV